MKLNKLIYDVREATKEYMDDTEVSNRYIAYLLNIKRSKYLRQELNNMQRTTDSTTIQTLTVKLEEVDSSDCGLQGVCEKIMRSCKKLPDPLALHTKNGITRVASLNKMSKPFNFVTREKVIYAQDAPFPNSIYTFLHDDGYLYVTSQNNAINLLECISVTGVWEDPTDLSRFSVCCSCEENNSACYNEDSEYPIQPHLIDGIRREVIAEILQMKQIPEDKENNGEDQ